MRWGAKARGDGHVNNSKSIAPQETGDGSVQFWKSNIRPQAILEYVTVVCLAVRDGTVVAHNKLTVESVIGWCTNCGFWRRRRMDFSDLKLQEIGQLHAHSQPDEVQWPEGMPPDPPVIPHPRQAPTDRPPNPERDPNPSRERQVPDKLPPRGEARYELSDVYMH